MLLCEPMLLDELFQYIFENRAADLLLIVVHSGVGLPDLHLPVEVNGRTDDHRIAVSRRDGGFQIGPLLRAVAHGRQQGADMGKKYEGVREAAHRRGPGVYAHCRSELLRGDDAGHQLKLPVGEGGPFLHNQAALTLDQFGIDNADG